MTVAVQGALCGPRQPLRVLKVQAEPARWCYGERRRQPGTWTLYADGPDADGMPSWYEPWWRYACQGCGKDRRWLG
jgi:hypothetical protein